MKYLIVEGKYSWEFINKVNEFIEKGWEPQGGIDTQKIGHCIYYFQAMIKREE